MNDIRKRRSFVVLAAAAAAVFFASAGVAAAATAMGKGKFVGMLRIPAGPFTMGRNGGPAIPFGCPSTISTKISSHGRSMPNSSRPRGLPVPKTRCISTNTTVTPVS